MEENEENNNSKKKITLKILILGDTEVGKTSILLKYIDHVFPLEHIATIGVEYKDKFITKDNYSIRLQIWDTAGQERFHSIAKSIYRNANGVLYIYDITKKQTFKSIKNWVKETSSIDKDIKGIILGNKIDLKNEREVNEDDLKEVSIQNNMPSLECSAKDNININEAFNLLIDELFKDKTEDQIMELYSRKNRSDLSVSTKKTHKKKKGGCC